jgi:UDPglucose 6-dehydrogenase
MGHDPRIGFEALHPGPGYGGSCFPKDTAALLHTADTADYDFEMLRAVIHTNDLQRERTFDKVRVAAGGSLQGIRVGVLGLTFKANTDDLRDSPALTIAARLVDEGAVVRAYDPAAGDIRAFGVDAVERVDTAYDAVAGASVVALLTEWDEFRHLDFAGVHAAMVAPHAFVDARNLLDPTGMRGCGFAYQGVGR